MNINFRRQSQFELFPGPSGKVPVNDRRGPLTKDLTLSLENIIVLCIIFVVSVVIFFSFGVEKGKRVARLESNPPVAFKVQQNEVDIAVAPEPVKSDSVADSQKMLIPVNIQVPPIEVKETDITVPADTAGPIDNLFTIQVASFKREENAQKEADRLKGVGHQDSFVIAKGSHSIVCVGKFDKMDEAKKFSSKLKKRYNDCLVRRL